MSVPLDLAKPKLPVVKGKSIVVSVLGGGVTPGLLILGAPPPLLDHVIVPVALKALG